MSDRKWEDLPADCLVDIFGRVGVVSLFLDVPFVCKSWYKATLNPLCWQSLIFPDDLPGDTDSESLSDCLRYACDEDWWLFTWEYYMAEFVKVVIRRSCGSARVVSLPDISLMDELVNCLGDECPSLRKLVLPKQSFKNDRILSRLSGVICKWNNLEALEITSNESLNELITQISLHCNKFVSLTADVDYIDESEASAIATLLPNIEFLCLKGSRIERSNLLIILKGCKKLVHFNAGFCIGLDVDADDEIRNLAAHIATFEFEDLDLDYNSSDDDY